MKKTSLLLAALAMLAVTAGCNQSSSTDENPSVDTNTPAQNAQNSASNAWNATKGAATNAYNAAEQGATNAWNKTTNAVEGGNTNQ